MATEEAQWAVKAKMYTLEGDKLGAVLERMGIACKAGLGKGSHLKTLESFIRDCAKDEPGGAKKMQLLLAAVSEEEMKEETLSEVPVETPPGVPAASNKKELKIHGSIGKQGISFINIIRQMDSAECRGYLVTEIIDAIIRAISPTEPLRGYIEGKTGLTLPLLRKLLRSYFQERSATELYQELSCGVQGRDEQTLDFVWRMLDLGQKVIFSCREEDSDITYEEKLVRKVTLRAIQTGLRDPLIAQELKTTLSGEPNDDVIVSEVSAAVSAEKERRQKNTRVASVRTLGEEDNKPPADHATLEILRDLQAQVAALRTDQGSRQPRPKRQCPPCKEAGRSDCSHCFQCGSSEHFWAGCRQRRNRRPKQGNDNESTTTGNR